MAIEILTYPDPYGLKEQAFWPELKHGPVFCASQTLVNSMVRLYELKTISTVSKLLDSLYPYWRSTACMVRQHSAIDHMLSPGNVSAGSIPPKFAQAFSRNRPEVFECLRTLLEVGIDTVDEDCEGITEEQRCLIKLCRALCVGQHQSDFEIESGLDAPTIDKAICETLNLPVPEISDVSLEKIFILGVHQFSPLMLRAIQEIAPHKTVSFVIEYQQQYTDIYSTWRTIYEMFGCPIVYSQSKEFQPDPRYTASYPSNIMADNIGKFLDGKFDEISPNGKIEMVEFDNRAEFSGYVASLFADAKRHNPVNPLSVMTEQFYAADGSANDILKTYFPEQYGEECFLDYPIGRFFVAIANMWDPQNNTIQTADQTDIAECLYAGVIEEAFPGQLLDIYNSVLSMFTGCQSLDDMLSRLKNLINRRESSYEDEGVETNHIAYFTVPLNDLYTLFDALNELKSIALTFFEDFNKQSHNFDAFYHKLRRFLQNEILDKRELNDEFADILRRVLKRLENVGDVNTTASFECLKSTMALYLTQEAAPANAAHWIVRNFEQIDGDILRSKEDVDPSKAKVFHFACLSDEDISSANIPLFPWPLSLSFFQSAFPNKTWTLNVFLTSREERKNFKKFALQYGLQFNRGKIRLSYIKRGSGDKLTSPFFPLQSLGCKCKPYKTLLERAYVPSVAGIHGNIQAPPSELEEIDRARFKLCPYRFLLESVIEGETVFKDAFLLQRSFSTLFENQLRREFQGQPTRAVNLALLNERLAGVGEFYPFFTETEYKDIASAIFQKFNRRHFFESLDSEKLDQMRIEEVLLAQSKKQDSKEDLDSSILKSTHFKPHVGDTCKFCANHDICLANHDHELQQRMKENAEKENVRADSGG